MLAGIDHTSGSSSVAFGLPTLERKQDATAIRIDLTNPNISFFTTPRGGGRDTLGLRLSDFLTGSPFSVGINANFCWPDFKGYEASYGQPGGYCTCDVPYKLFGLAMSEGEYVSCLETVAHASSPGATALMITKTNHASIGCVTRDLPPPPETWTAVAGGPQPARPTGPDFRPAFKPTETVGGPSMVVQGGMNMVEPALIPREAVSARTAVGISKDKRTMYWLTVDDVAEYNPDASDFDPETPQIGASFCDVAEWLLMLGAYEGMTLDGGKSTSMAWTGGDGQPVLMNSPRADGGEKEPIDRLRCLGNFLGVHSGRAAI